MTDPDSRYSVLPRHIRLERRAGAGIAEIQIARARAYVARLEAELEDPARPLGPADRARKQRALADWRAHLATLRSEARARAMRIAAE